MAAKKHAKIPAKPKDVTKSQSAKHGKKSDNGSGGSFCTWFIVLALLGVWTSVAVVYFDLVDYQGVLDKAKGFQINLSDALQGKLVAYDTDGDGDFDVEDAKVLLDEAPGDAAGGGAHKESSPTKEAGSKLREALKRQLAVIHERLEAKKLARLALAEVRLLLAKEEDDKELELGRKDMAARAKERVAARLQQEEDKMVEEEMEKVNQTDVTKEEASKEKEGEKKSRKRENEKAEKHGEGKKAPEEGRVKEKRKGSKAERSDRRSKKSSEV
ncbi:aspartyl/asparaginyl beta-hydroxylase isoform X2 [Pseudoliparis swirei]|uniref:aspartyl/asparaginyl beta-hydroxylase isoform X2 n=1 Tax=Pseudoliparis swirei TaxID=2059687 RepID=UPI0024BD5E42|nr:aspartyl/asparaginyl beta-hydroxylase isoform X2 [Pseudoliparis swirei]